LDALLGKYAPSKTITGTTPWWCSRATRRMQYVTKLCSCD
jgi:hypothetical protein